MKLEKKLELMKTMFNPKSVAIMGASDTLIKIGGMVVTNIRMAGFKNTIYAINPKPRYADKKIHGIDVYPSLDKCPGPIDLVGIVVPPNAVLDSIKQAIECDIRTAAIITAGFGEVQTEERQDANKKLVSMTQKAGMIFVGPNSLGLYSSENQTSPIHLGMGFMLPHPGNTAIISQSGTIGTLLCNMLKRIRHFVSSGNEASLTLEDYLAYFAQDELVEVIALFVEGLRNVPQFKEICSELAPKKPIVFLKAGRTGSGARAAYSHTASIGGSTSIYSSYFKQAGIIEAVTLNEFLDLVRGAGYLLPLPSNDPLRVGIMFGGGGLGVHLTDLCTEEGLDVVNLRTHPKGPALIEELSEHLPFFWSKNNPMDLVATRRFDLVPTLIDIILKHDIFDLLIIQTAALFRQILSSFEPRNDFGKRMLELMEIAMADVGKRMSKAELAIHAKHPNKRIVYLTLGSSLSDPLFDEYDKRKIMVFAGNPGIATVVLRKLHEYQLFVDRRKVLH